MTTDSINLRCPSPHENPANSEGHPSLACAPFKFIRHPVTATDITVLQLNELEYFGDIGGLNLEITNIIKAKHPDTIAHPWNSETVLPDLRELNSFNTSQQPEPNFLYPGGPGFPVSLSL